MSIDGQKSHINCRNLPKQLYYTPVYPYLNISLSITALLYIYELGEYVLYIKANKIRLSEMYFLLILGGM
jgi:hypothetical protein